MKAVHEMSFLSDSNNLEDEILLRVEVPAVSSSSLALHMLSLAQPSPQTDLGENLVEANNSTKSWQSFPHSSMHTFDEISGWSQ